MPNFLQNVGRSNISSSIRDLVQTKIGLDANARADQTAVQQQALSAEQLKILQRQGQAADEKMKFDNTPLPVNVLADSIEGGKDGPIFAHLYKAAKAQGLVDESNPNNPVILRKHVNNEMAKVFEKDAMQINNLRLDYLYQNKAAVQAELSKKPGDEKLTQQLEAFNQKISQATMHDADLREATKLAQTAKIAQAHDTVSKENAQLQAETSRQNNIRSTAATLKTAADRLAQDKSSDPTAKMPPNVKLSWEWIKKFNETHKTDPIMAMIAANDPNGAAAKALAQQQQTAQDPEMQQRLAFHMKNLDEWSGIKAPAPEGVREEDIQHTMKLHNLSREEVLSRLNGTK